MHNQGKDKYQQAFADLEPVSSTDGSFLGSSLQAQQQKEHIHENESITGFRKS
ncbi:MAG: hypothetical protein HWQ40_01745 [Nostoc sp. NMS9]|nr:hypothetical protein [Nostoc sp. NMS9]MBN3938699.1 hypothetical protein [Nostoc sp. NMS9]